MGGWWWVAVAVVVGAEIGVCSLTQGGWAEGARLWLVDDNAMMRGYDVLRCVCGVLWCVCVFLKLS